MSTLPKFQDLPDLPDGKSARCEPEAVPFSLNGGQGPHLRLVLLGKRGRGGPRQEPEACLEVFMGRDALGAEQWRPFDPSNGARTLDAVLAHFYLALTGRRLAARAPGERGGRRRAVAAPAATLRAWQTSAPLRPQPCTYAVRAPS